MLPPIYQCAGGHSICQDCRPNLQECPLCRSVIQTTQNFTLEKVTQYMVYPCKFYKTGCTYSSKSTEIRQHENSCEFGPYKCPLNEFVTCDWKDNSAKLAEHVTEKHSDKLITNDRINVNFNKEQPAAQYECYLIKLLKRCFALHYKFENDKFYWSVQLVGPSNECKKYRMDIDLVDYSGNKRRCYLTGLVAPLSDRDSSFRNSSNYLTLPLEMVEPFINENVFGFRVVISTD